MQEGMSEAQTVKTIIHEAAHQALHSKNALEASGEKKSKNQKETEAESVAYVVCQHYGIDTSDYSFGYIAGWSKDKEVSELKENLEIIKATADEMSALLEQELNMRKEVKKQESIDAEEVDSKKVRKKSR